MIPIPQFEGKYSITQDGRVFSHSRIAKDGRKVLGRWLKPAYDVDGYKRIMLYSGGRGSGKNLRVCRLVALTYINNPENKLFVNHINGNKQDDFVSNLEWVTAKENTQHAWKNGLCKAYDRTLPYNRQGIIESNKRRVCGI